MNDMGHGVQFRRRSEWGARPPRSRTSFTPEYGSSGHWEGPRMGAFPHASCDTKVRGIQAFHMDDRGWSDIAYTAVVCPHGVVYEGRWIGARTAANGTNAGNGSAYAVCYLGGQGDGFTAAGRLAMRVVFDYLDVHGGAGPNRNCHRNWKATECPGDEICTYIHEGMPIPQEDPDMALTEAQVRDIFRQELAAAMVPLMAAVNAGRPILIKGDEKGAWFSFNGVETQYVENRHEAAVLVLKGVLPKGFDSNGEPYPHVWPQAVVDNLPRADD